MKPLTIPSLTLTAVVLLSYSAARAEDTRPSIDEIVARLKDADLAVRRDAAYELASIGAEAKDAVPALIEALGDTDQQVWFQATQALARIGPDASEAIAPLVDILKAHSGQRMHRTAYALGSIGIDALPALRELLSSQTPSTRQGAVRALGVMGATATPAIRDLIGLLADPDETVRVQAAIALAAIGVPAEASLGEALNDSDRLVRLGAALALGRLRPQNREIIERLQEIVRTDDPEVAGQALDGLTTSNVGREETLKLAVHAIAGEKQVLRERAVTGFARLGQDAAPAIPQLVGLLGSEDSSIRQAAIEALGFIGGKSQIATDPILSVLRMHGEDEGTVTQALTRIGIGVIPELLNATDLHGEHPALLDVPAGIGGSAVGPLVDAASSALPEVRTAALSALGRMTPAPDAAIPTLLSALTDDEAAVRKVAAAALAKYTRPTDEVTQALLSATKDGSADVRSEAVLALSASFPDRTKLVPLWGEALNDPNVYVRTRVLEAVAIAGPPARPLGAHLIALMTDADSSVRAAAAKAIGATGAPFEEAVPVLTQALRDDAQTVRIQAAHALATYGKDALSAVSSLLGVAQGPDTDAAIAAITALSKVGFAAEGSTPVLVSLLSHESPAVRSAAAEALPDTERDITRIIVPLTEALRDDDWLVRKSACFSLGKLGGDSSPAVPVLFQLLRTREDFKNAADALEAIDAAGPEALPVLMDVLNDNDDRTRRFVLRFLGKLGPDAKDALPRLNELREQAGDDREKEAYDKAIAAIEGESSE